MGTIRRTLGGKPPYCARCNESFALHEDMAKTGEDEFWHLKCFVCAQCFRPFNQDHEYYEFEGRKYCQKDFQTLFAPCCAECHQFIIGRFIRAMNSSWHPNCFECHSCGQPLCDQGFIKSKNRALCHDCHAVEKESPKGRHVCEKCNCYVDDEDLLKIKDNPYHAYHFHCHACKIELRPDARQVESDLYCLKCHDKLQDIPICGACRRPIDNDERVVTALGKHFHVDHFACAQCEKPFLGKRHYEWKGLAYCETDYYHLFGYECYVCNQTIRGEVVSALDKYWCTQHFTCSFCDTSLVPAKTKFHDVDSRPCCKKCFKKLPRQVRKRLAKEHKDRDKERKSGNKKALQQQQQVDTSDT